MHKTRIFAAIGFCLIVIARLATAQDSRKPGLWEITTTMTWQQSPLPAGMPLPATASSPFGSGPRTTQVCLTQSTIDKLGTPQIRGNQCEIANVHKKPGSITADWICTGLMAGKGTLGAFWADSTHTISKLHFLGSMRMGQNATPVEYTMDSASVYKGSDCGSVKAAPTPDK